MCVMLRLTKCANAPVDFACDMSNKPPLGFSTMSTVIYYYYRLHPAIAAPMLMSAHFAMYVCVWRTRENGGGAFAVLLCCWSSTFYRAKGEFRCAVVMIHSVFSTGVKRNTHTQRRFSCRDSNSDNDNDNDDSHNVQQ